MRRHRRLSGEINLTPLLDVLFSILFIVMLTSARNEANMQTEASEKIDTMQQELSDLENQVTVVTNENQSYEMYENNAVIVTIFNVSESNKHILVISNNRSTDEERIQLGEDVTENTALRLNSIIQTIVEETDNQPIYLVFHCDKYCIFTKEYIAIDEALLELENENKEVFYKVMEVDE